MTISIPKPQNFVSCGRRKFRWECDQKSINRSYRTAPFFPQFPSPFSPPLPPHTPNSKNTFIPMIFQPRGEIGRRRHYRNGTRKNIKTTETDTETKFRRPDPHVHISASIKDRPPSFPSPSPKDKRFSLPLFDFTFKKKTTNAMTNWESIIPVIYIYQSYFNTKKQENKKLNYTLN